jgi:hypothetical protein
VTLLDRYAVGLAALKAKVRIAGRSARGTRASGMPRRPHQGTSRLRVSLTLNVTAEAVSAGLARLLGPAHFPLRFR